MRIVRAIAIVLVLGLVSVGGYRYYDRHFLSAEMKRLLRAAVDPSSSRSDEASYVRDARTQIRTQRDATVFRRFQRCMKLMEAATTIEEYASARKEYNELRADLGLEPLPEPSH